MFAIHSDMVSRRRGGLKPIIPGTISSSSSSSVVGTAAAVTLKLPIQHQLKEVRMIAQMKTV
jgi:hypothetical protein